jgi:hypothetical protein
MYTFSDADWPNTVLYSIAYYIASFGMQISLSAAVLPENNEKFESRYIQYKSVPELYLAYMYGHQSL